MKWALLADAAINSDGGKLTLIGLFDTIFARSVPAIHSKLALVFKLECSSAEYDQTKHLKIALLSADGKTVMALEADLRIARPSAPLLGIENVIDIQNVPLPEFGDYAFHILIGGETKHVLPLRVVEVNDNGQNSNPEN